MDGENLAAVCGLYCGACEFYRAGHDDSKLKRQEFLQSVAARLGSPSLDSLQCDGCLGHGHLTPWCHQCALRLCPADKPGVIRCSDCADFPCSRIVDFNNDGMQHHAEVLANLRQFREKGVGEWVKHEEARWRCSQCGNSLGWYDQTCLHCGAKRPGRLFPLPPH
jgi:hypothetical protein